MLSRFVHLRFAHSLFSNINEHLPAWLSGLFYSIGGLTGRSDSDTRYKYFDQAFAHVAIRQISGDYLEYGVFYGKSFKYAYQSAKKHRLRAMRFFAFDSFTGYPYPDDPLHEQNGLRGSKDLFVKYIRRIGMDMKRVIITEGVYRDSLIESVKYKSSLQKAAIVHIDCDQYESTKDVLDFIGDLVGKDSIIIFGDWHSYPRELGSGGADHPGYQQAFREWPISERCEEFFDSDHGRAFIVR